MQLPLLQHPPLVTALQQPLSSQLYYLNACFASPATAFTCQQRHKPRQSSSYVHARQQQQAGMCPTCRERHPPLAHPAARAMDTVRSQSAGLPLLLLPMVGSHNGPHALNTDCCASPAAASTGASSLAAVGLPPMLHLRGA